MENPKNRVFRRAINDRPYILKRKSGFSTVCGGGRKRPTVRIPYAEREPATGRERPMALFNHRPARTNWVRALPGVHKKFSILFVQSVLYYHQRAPGWADPGRKKQKNANIFAGSPTIYQTIQGQRGWRWPLGIHALFVRNELF